MRVSVADIVRFRFSTDGGTAAIGSGATWPKGRKDWPENESRFRSEVIPKGRRVAKPDVNHNERETDVNRSSVEAV